MEATRATKLGTEESACDVELLLRMKALPWDRKRREPIADHVAGRSSCTNRASSRVPGPRTVYIRKNVEIRKSGQTLGCQGFLAVATNNSINLSQHRMWETCGKCNA